MRKRILSLLCVLALCLGLLPVTALAAETAPEKLYVGSTQIYQSGYWTYSDGSTTWTHQSDKPLDGSYIYYDGSGTLTLHNATITGNNSSSESLGAGIYAVSSANSDVALTIKLEGTSTVSGYYGVCVQANQVSSSAGNSASLTISGDGTLIATETDSYGIVSWGYLGGASLTIENATVTASTSGRFAAGVCVQSGSETSDSPQLSLAVNGGSLTASGGTSSDGILFYVGSPNATGAVTSLTVSGNAIVDAKTGGISATRDMSPIDTTISSSTTDSNGGIVWNGKDGTVYGNVELQENLEIGEGETLTIRTDASLTVPDGKTLTNNGTILVESGGTLEGTVTPPTISKHPESKSVVSLEYVTFSVEATASYGDLTYQWQQSTDNGSTWNNIDDATSGTYNIQSTETYMSGYQYRCVVTAGGVSVISNAATLKVTERPEYTITADVDPEEAGSATVNGSGTSATVEANSTVRLAATANEGYRFTGWTSSNGVTFGDASSANTTFIMPAGDVTVTANFEQVYTVTISSTIGGTATANKTTAAAGDTVTLTATPNSGYRFTGWTSVGGGTFGDAFSASTTFTMPAAAVTVTANFEKVYTVTVNASGNGTATADKTTVAEGETVTLTATPASGYHFDGWSVVSGIVTIQNNQFTMPAENVEIQAIFDRNSSGGSTTPSKTPSQQATDKIEAAKDGSTVEITLKSGQTTLDKEVFEELSGKDVTLVIKLPSGVTWSVNGLDIPENAKLSDLDLGVTLDASTIPASVVNAITGAVDTIQLTLAHDGEFGFTLTLTAPLGKEYADLWANLYHYDEDAGKMVYQTAALVDEDGNVTLPFTHASQYALVLDSKSHDLPFTDLIAGAWYADAVAYVYRHDLMAGTSATTFAPDVTTSRAMIATILWRMAGSPVVNYAMTYTDVDPAAWYGEAVRWAASEGVVTGYGNGLFGTNDPITREQFATMLWRYAQTEDYDVTMGEDTNILSYTDFADLSEYAIPAMQWACGAGILEGNAGHLYPQGDATRAEVATMLMRFGAEYVVW